MLHNTKTGERLSFYQLVSNKSYGIQIPIIQRDYAQGRDTASEVRSVFLNALYKYLEEGNTVDLDFVYGTLEGDDNVRLVPLDGQQRLTTLFLLHWYLAQLEGRQDAFRYVMMRNGQSVFTYETRISSREFCTCLVERNIQIPSDPNTPLSQIIQDEPWFFLFWQHDPTIHAMLVMLNAIHNKFCQTTGFYDRLTDAEHPAITFQFIELNSFKLSDALYIKMNARGKALTEFENLKARFEQLLEQKDKQNGSTLKSEFARKMDGDWTDLFWNYKDLQTAVFDEEFMNFMRVTIANTYALRGNDETTAANLKLLIGKENPENREERTKKIDYYKYEELGCFDDQAIADIIAALDGLKNGTGTIANYLPDSLINEDTLFAKIINNNPTYTERVQFYALCQYLRHHESKAGIEVWMRVIRNLSENIFYNEASEYAASIRAVADLIPYSNDILSYLTNWENPVRSFTKEQIEEERIKAVLLQKNEHWREAIINVEDHGYFRGQIGFILSFSGIIDYQEKNGHLNWSEEEDQQFLSAFRNYTTKSSIVFTENGLFDFEDFKWERALLCIGDYLLRKGRNLSFVDDADRDVSWKRLLREKEKRSFVKELLDRISIESITEDLERVISEYAIDDWRRYFIQYPEILRACGKKKFIRKDGDFNILLLQKTATNGTHREYYSYALYLKLKQQGYPVYYKEDSSVDYEKYLYWLGGENHNTGISIKICFGYYQETWQYKMEINGCNTYFENEAAILASLSEQGLLV